MGEERRSTSFESIASKASHDLCRVLAAHFPTDALSKVPVIRSWGRYGACVENVCSKSQVCNLVVHPFGSVVNGFGKHASDLDLVICLADVDERLITSFVEYDRFCKFLRSQACELDSGDTQDQGGVQGSAALVLGRLHEILISSSKDSVNSAHDFKVMELVLDARIPILRLSRHSIPVDLSFGNLEPLRNTLLLRSYADRDERVSALCSALKIWARQQNICGAKQGHLSSYAFTLMGIYFLQVGLETEVNGRCESGGHISFSCICDDELPLPSLQAITSEQEWSLDACGVKWHERDFKDGEEMPRVCQGHDFCSNHALLSRLFRFYAHDFGWGHEVVSIRIGRRSDRSALAFTKLPIGRDTLDIEDPFLLDRNLNCHIKSAANSRALRQAFQIADCLESLRFCELGNAVACFLSREVLNISRKKKKETNGMLSQITPTTREKDRTKQVASEHLMKLSAQLADNGYFSPDEDAPCFQCKRRGLKGRAAIWKSTARWFCQRCWVLWDRQCAKTLELQAST